MWATSSSPRNQPGTRSEALGGLALRPGSQGGDEGERGWQLSAAGHGKRNHREVMAGNDRGLPDWGWTEATATICSRAYALLRRSATSSKNSAWPVNSSTAASNTALSSAMTVLSSSFERSRRANATCTALA